MADRAVGADDVLLGAVDQMQDHGAALDMAEKAGTEAGSFAGAFDQPRQIGHDEFGVVVEAHDAKLRMQCRKGVIGDLGAGMRHAGQQGRFAGIGQPDEAGIRDQFQAQPDP